MTQKKVEYQQPNILSSTVEFLEPEDINHFSNKTELDSIPERNTKDGGNGGDYWTSNRTTPQIVRKTSLRTQHTQIQQTESDDEDDLETEVAGDKELGDADDIYYDCVDIDQN